MENKKIKIKFLGGAKEVGRSAILLSSGDTTILLDYGVLLNREPDFPMHVPPKTLDAIVISHAHLDHSGGAPIFYLRNKIPLYTTDLTLQLTKILINDLIKLSGYYLPYDHSNLEAMENCLINVDYKKEFRVGDLSLEFREAGHIPGSFQTIVKADSKTIVYTADINTRETRLLKAADTNYGEVSCIILEATYANEDHPERLEEEKAFVKRAKEVVEDGGTVLVPAFSVGRCLHPETLIQLADGSIVPVKELTTPCNVVSLNFNEKRLYPAVCMEITARASPKNLLKVKTKFSEIIVTPEHRMFVFDVKSGEIKEKEARYLTTNDFLINVRKLSLKTSPQKLNTQVSVMFNGAVPRGEIKSYFDLYEQGFGIDRIAEKFDRSSHTVWMYLKGKRKFMENPPVTRIIKLPTETNSDLCQFIGYLLGDGCIDGDSRIRLFDSDIKLLKHYSKLLNRLFGIRGYIRKEKRRKGSYYLLEINSRMLVRFLKLNFKELFEKGNKRKIPQILLRASDKEVSACIRGFFDAEASINVRSGFIYVSNVNRNLLEVFSLLLRRFGIVSKVEKVVGRREYRLILTGDNVRIFYRRIGFSSTKKKSKLKRVLSNKKAFSSQRKIFPLGSIIHKIIKRLQITSSDLRTCGISSKNIKEDTNFSSQTLKKFLKIVERYENRLNKRCPETELIKKILEGDVILDKVRSVEVVKSNSPYVYDLSVPGYENFLANSLVVHNSQEVLCILEAHNFEYPVMVDGMALTVNEVMLNHPEYFRDYYLLRNALENARWVNRWKERKEATKKPCVIVSPAGMLQGGAAAFYINRVAKEKRNAIFLVSYQIPGTPGRKLLEEKKIFVNGKPKQVEATVEKFDFSSHAGRSDLESLLKSLEGNPTVYLVHGNKENCQGLAEWVKTELGFEAIAPSMGEVYKV